MNDTNNKTRLNDQLLVRMVNYYCRSRNFACAISHIMRRRR